MVKHLLRTVKALTHVSTGTYSFDIDSTQANDSATNIQAEASKEKENKTQNPRNIYKLLYIYLVCRSSSSLQQLLCIQAITRRLFYLWA